MIIKLPHSHSKEAIETSSKRLHMESLRKKRAEERKAKEREQLYKWAPGIELEPTSERFDKFIARFTNEKARNEEKRETKRKIENEKFMNVLEKHQKRNKTNMMKRENRILQAQKKRNYDQVKKVDDVDDTDQGSYHSKISENDSC